MQSSNHGDPVATLPSGNFNATSATALDVIEPLTSHLSGPSRQSLETAMPGPDLAPPPSNSTSVAPPAGDEADGNPLSRLVRSLSSSFSRTGSATAAEDGGLMRPPSQSLERSRSLDALKHSTSFSRKPEQLASSDSIDMPAGSGNPQLNRTSSSSSLSNVPAPVSAADALPTALPPPPPIPASRAAPPLAPLAAAAVPETGPQAVAMKPDPPAQALTESIAAAAPAAIPLVEPVMASNLGIAAEAADEESSSSNRSSRGPSSSSSSTTEPPPTQRKKGSSNAAIPIAAGVVLALAAAGAVAWRLLKAKGSGEKQPQQQKSEGAAAAAGGGEVDEAEALEKARRAAAGVNAMGAGKGLVNANVY